MNKLRKINDNLNDGALMHYRLIKEHKSSTLSQCFIVAQKFNLQRQAPFLPMQC